MSARAQRGRPDRGSGARRQATPRSEGRRPRGDPGPRSRTNKRPGPTCHELVAPKSIVRRSVPPGMDHRCTCWLSSPRRPARPDEARNETTVRTPRRAGSGHSVGHRAPAVEGAGRRSRPRPPPRRSARPPRGGVRRGERGHHASGNPCRHLPGRGCLLEGAQGQHPPVLGVGHLQARGRERERLGGSVASSAGPGPAACWPRRAAPPPPPRAGRRRWRWRPR